jgi:hypothetical protein
MLPRSEHGDNVSFLEVVPLEKERLAGVLGQRVGEAIAEIQSGGVTALAEVVEGLARKVRVLHCDGLDDDAGPAEKHIALANCLRANLAFDDDGEFQEVSSADQAAVCVMNDLGVLGGLWFVEENGGEGRGVEDHLGRPRSS